MPQQQIIWTALPNGITGDGLGRKLRLSVCVSPRLRFDGTQQSGTLAAFPHFLDWPARLRDGRIAFDVLIDGPAPGTAQPAIRAAIVTADPPDSTLWRALFTEATLVRSRAFQPIDEPVLRNPTGEMATNVRKAYAKVGRDSPFRAPDHAALGEAFPNVTRALAPDPTTSRMTPERLRQAVNVADRDLEVTHRDIGEQVLRRNPELSFDQTLAAVTTLAGRRARSQATPRAVPVVPLTDQPESAVAQFAAFHTRVPAAERVARRASARTGDPEQLDFHRTLSALGEYPTLLRKLGLTIDLEIPAAAVPESIFGSLKRLRVMPLFTPETAPAETYAPATKYIFDQRTGVRTFPFAIFTAAPRRAATAPSPDPVPDLEIVAGLLNVGLVVNRVNPFRLVQHDVDGTMKKVLNVIQSEARDEASGRRPVDSASKAHCRRCAPPASRWFVTAGPTR